MSGTAGATVYDTIYHQLVREHERYDHTNTTQEGPMSLTSIEQSIRTGVKDVEQHVHDWAAGLEPHLGHLADIAASVEQSPLVQAALAAVLPPGVEAEIAALIGKLHETFNAAVPEPEPVPAQPAA